MFPEVIVPKGPKNPYGSVTGPFNTAGGWGKPAEDDDCCPKCGSKTFHYESGFAECATNVCKECDYNEHFAY